VLFWPPFLYENNSAREEVKHGEIYTGSSRASYFACMQIGSGRMGLAAATAAAAPAPATRKILFLKRKSQHFNLDAA
jgi:hypothetical protein